MGNAVYIGKEALPVSRRYRAELYAAYDFLESWRIEEGKCVTEKTKKIRLVECPLPTD